MQCPRDTLGWYLRDCLQVALGVENSTRDREVMCSTESRVPEGYTLLPSFLTRDATAPTGRLRSPATTLVDPLAATFRVPRPQPAPLLTSGPPGPHICI